MRIHRITVSELADYLHCKLEGDGSLVIDGVETIEHAGSSQLTFLANPRYRKHLADCKAGAVIVAEDVPSPAGMIRLVSDNPYRDFRLSVEKLYEIPSLDVVDGIHPQSSVDYSAKIGEGIQTGPFVHIAANVTIGKRCMILTGAYIARDAQIGDNCVIGVNVSIRHEVRIGSRVLIGDGSVIGYDGFGYVPGKSGYQQIPPVGRVVIEDDVDIGANCCIDRATIGETLICRGTKLDNLIQIAHGVRIGEDTAIAAQAGISGSTTIGSNVLMGGQAGLVGHIHIGDGMIVGAQAGVTKSFDFKGMISGYPARPQSDAKRMEASLSKLPELVKKIRDLERRIDELGNK